MRSIALVLCAACSSAPAPSFGPIATATSAACDASFVYSADVPLARGASTIRIVATDLSTNAPRENLAISIDPFMPAMGHGSATDPAVVDQGGGVYVASDVVMAMPGTWQLRTTISGACSDSLVVDVNVQ